MGKIGIVPIEAERRGLSFGKSESGRSNCGCHDKDYLALHNQLLRGATGWAAKPNLLPRWDGEHAGRLERERSLCHSCTLEAGRQHGLAVQKRAHAFDEQR